ncbi:MAG: hypothetical protein AVDCRST_MAG96-3810 [uncultured Segetibacter sp.]|uniref:Uncharacterized protein n=1 Tax=uncultured Segetibacter sp. TaxID=481133 RepID=A0A6J4TZ25_9BACT|nr:MAG: hypothetical protein AVDCRST_MAG96-3810 [uncultured Segetibacter sp.]
MPIKQTIVATIIVFFISSFGLLINWSLKIRKRNYFFQIS